MQLPEKIEDLKDAVTEKLDAPLTWLEDKLGDRTRATAALAAGFIVVILAIVFTISLIPWTAAPAPEPAPPTENLGSGITSEDRGEENAEQNAKENIPDEAKTVRELSQERVVKATFEYMVDPTHIVVTLPNADQVTVRLINVAPTDDCAYAEEGSNPFDLVRDGGCIWLERDDVTQEEDGTWPRYVWTNDPANETSISSSSLWQAMECSPGRHNYTYTPEEGMDRNTEIFESFANPVEDENARRQQELIEQQQREWQERKEEQERLEAESNGTSVDMAPGTRDGTNPSDDNAQVE